MTRPIDRMINAVVKCTLCGARPGQCRCWVLCRCSWWHERGRGCHNPDCTETS